MSTFAFHCLNLKQVNSTAGTIAANYWFNGLHSAVVESAPHVAPYLLRTLANSMLDTARASLVFATASPLYPSNKLLLLCLYCYFYVLIGC